MVCSTTAYAGSTQSNVSGHSDDTGVCPCEKCNCNPQGATVNNDECLSCQ